jgi:HTH-type transcriptional regulator / antitoxin HipB
MKLFPISKISVFPMSKAEHSRIRSSADLGRQIRAARKIQGLTQAELAEAAGVGVRFVSDLERGKETARLGQAIDLARLVGLDLLALPRSETRE